MSERGKVEVVDEEGKGDGRVESGKRLLRYENPHIIVIVIVMDQPQCCNFVIGNRHVVSMCVYVCVCGCTTCAVVSQDKCLFKLSLFRYVPCLAASKRVAGIRLGDGGSALGLCV